MRETFLRKVRSLLFSKSSAWCFAAAALSLLTAILSFGVNLHNIDVPVIYRGDGYQCLVFLKGFAASGDMFWDQNLGAPTGTTKLEQFPNNALWNYICTAILATVTQNSSVGANLYILLGFPLAVTTSFIVMRKLHLSNPASFLGSFAYSLLPFHFYNAAHITLQAYYVVPPALYLCCRILRPESQGWKDKFVGALFILGLTSTYYSLFFCFLLVSSGLLGAMAWRKLRHLKFALGYTALLVAVMLLGTNQTLLTWAFEGRLDSAHQRFSFEAEMYGLRLGQLLLPSLGHNSETAVEFKTKYMDGKEIYENEHASLGFLGAVGFLASVFWLLNPSRGREADDFYRLAVLNLLCFLFATKGGLGSITAVYFPALRCLTRFSVLIAFLSLCCFARLLDLAMDRLDSNKSSKVRPLLLALLTPFVVWDQVPLPHLPDHSAITEQYRSDQDFVERLEKNLPKGALVFTWPYDQFPEASVTSRLYIHSNDIRWSGGAIPGTPQDDWYREACGLPTLSLLKTLRRFGFRGIVLDRNLASTKNTQSEFAKFHDKLEERVRKVLTSSDHNLVFFDLSQEPENIVRLNVSFQSDLAYPEQFYSGFSALESADGEGFVWSDGPNSVLKLPKLTSQSHILELRAAALNLLDEVEVDISINGKPLSSEKFTKETKIIQLPVPAELLQDSNLIKLAYNKTLNSSDFKEKLQDQRDLGLRFSSISWSATKGPKEPER